MVTIHGNRPPVRSINLDVAPLTHSCAQRAVNWFVQQAAAVPQSNAVSLAKAAQHFGDSPATQSAYDPATPYLRRVASHEGIIGPSTDASLAPDSAAELIAQHRIALSDAQAILHGRLTIMTVGRSGFVDETDNRYFGLVMQEFFNEAFHTMRRAGLDPSDVLALTTSATAGTVDVGVRRAATFHRIPSVAFISDDLMPWVDPQDVFMPGVLHTGSVDYSAMSIGMADVVTTLPGGAFSLLNDMPHALMQGKEIVIIYDPRVPKVDKSIFDGSTRIGNHGSALVDEHDQLTCELIEHVQACHQSTVDAHEIWDPTGQYADDVTQYISQQNTLLAQLVRKMDELGQPMSPQAIWQRITIARTPKEWATYLLHKLGHNSRPVDDIISDRTATPVFSGTGSLAGTKLNVAFTGRSQFVNRTAGYAELRHITTMLKRLDVLLTNRYGYSRRDIGVVHGMSNYGADGAFLREMVMKGYPGIGIVKPEWAQWTDANAKFRSDYVLTEDTYEAFSQGYMGVGLGFSTDALVVFEGNAGVKDHVREAVKLGIPVIVVPLTSDPMFGDFYDLQKRRTFPNRLQNIGRWVVQAEREAIIPKLWAKISESAGVDTLDRDVQRIEGEVQALCAAEVDDTRKAQLKHALGLVREIRDMHDPRTTADANPNIIVTNNMNEIGYLLHRIERRKNQK